MERLEIHIDPLITSREVVGSFIFDNWNGLDPCNTSNQKILMA